MPNHKVPIYDLSFWWLRYSLGIAVPLALLAWGMYSIVTLHSYFISRYRPFLVPLEGEQAVLIGVAYIGIALMLFANYYVQYHKTMGFYYQWLLTPGALLTIGGILGCCWTGWISVVR